MSRISIVRTLLIIGIIAAAAAIRVGQFIPNVAPITAMALLSGATLTMPWALAVPIIGMVVSDSIIGFDSLPITVAVYGSFLLTVVLGTWLKQRTSPLRIISSSLISSTLFYLITNAAVWRYSTMYPQTMHGLWLSYFYALPFFRNTVLGDMMYTTTLFLAVYYLPQVVSFLVQRYKPTKISDTVSMAH